MSRIINCETSNDFKTWNAPNLIVSNECRSDINKNSQLSNSDSESPEVIRQKAYEKSFAKGYMEGLAKGQHEINEKVEHLQSLLAALTMPLPNLDDQVVDELVQLSMAVVKHMIRRELKMSPDEIVAVVKEALSVLPSAAAEITIELHPQDARIISETLVHPTTNSNWKIKEDPLLTRGGCRVLTSTSRIDATVENRINNVIAKVMGDERLADDL